MPKGRRSCLDARCAAVHLTIRNTGRPRRDPVQLSVQRRLHVSHPPATMNRSPSIARRIVLLTPAASPSLATGPGIAQPHPDSSFAVVLYGGAGFTRYVAEINTPAGIRASLHPGGAAFTFRAMWYPDHLLRIGIETGWVRFFSYTLHGATDGNLYTLAAPLLLVFSMPMTGSSESLCGGRRILRLVEAGFRRCGARNELSQGWMLGASYHFPLTGSLGIAAEAKWYNASQFEDGNDHGPGHDRLALLRLVREVTVTAHQPIQGTARSRLPHPAPAARSHPDASPHAACARWPD